MKLFFSTPNKKKRRRGVHATKRTLGQRWSEYVWPSMGWGAFLRWLEIKVKRAPGERDRVAMGAAIGMFVTFLPLVGVQVVLMWLLAQLLRGHFWVAVLFSVVGNPWTFPFIWLVSHQLGMMLLWREATVLPTDISVSHIMQNMGFYWDAFLLPTLVGGIPLGLAAAVITYYVVHFNVRSYQKARQAFLARRRAEEREKRKLRDVAGAAATSIKEKASAFLQKDNDKEENERKK